MSTDSSLKLMFANAGLAGVLALACYAISPVAFGQGGGDAAAGKKLADDWQCIVCHGPDGNGNKVHMVGQGELVPRISAQPQAYFIKSMHDYKSGKRSNDDMQSMADQLSDKQIRDLAAWYGSQTPKAEATYDYSPRR